MLHLPDAPPGFRTRDATLSDVKEITRLWYASFNASHRFWEIATPDDAPTRKWLDQTWKTGILAGPDVFRTFVVEDLSLSNKLVAFIRFHVPQPNGSQDLLLPEPPTGWDKEVADALWGGMARNRNDVMGQRLHWFGEFLAVDSRYKLKGIGRCLMGWFCHRADEMGLDIYGDATPAALPLYRKYHGFQEIKPLHFPKRPSSYGTYQMTAIVRKPRACTYKTGRIARNMETRGIAGLAFIRLLPVLQLGTRRYGKVPCTRVC